MTPPPAPHRRPHAILTAAAASVLVALAGCAQNRATGTAARPQPTLTREQAEAAALRRLIALADSQSKSPLKSDADAPPPPGLDAALAQPVTPASADPHAYTSLADAVAALAAKPLAGAVERAKDLDPEAADSALRLYISGRQKALEGDHAGAIKDLSAATKLDPTAGEPWRELGEAHMAAGSRSEAAASFQKAVERGLADPRVLEVLGRLALERGDTATAGAMLARAYRASPAKADPFLPQVIGVALWRALSSEGYIVAARDALREAVNRPAQLSSSTRYNAEFSAILRRTGDLWREIGDADCRLGDYAAAAEAYDEASQEPSLEGKSLLTRQVFALVRSGRPAGAAVEVLQQIMEAGGQADPESVDLIRYLSRTTTLSTQIASALEAYRQSAALPASLAGGLARAQAAIATPHQARDTLDQQVIQHPSDLRSAVDLFNLIGDPAAAASQAAAICAERPMQAGRIAEALLRSDLAVEPFLAALRRASPRDAATLVLAYTLAGRGDVGAAADAVAPMRPGGERGPAVALAQVEIGLLSGRPALARQGLSSLDSGVGTDWARAHARALAWTQRAKPALRALEPTLNDPSQTPDERLDDLMLAGDLAIANARTADAERWYRQAAAIDPLDDRPAAKLLAIYSPGGARPDAGQVNQLVRDLRTNMPESHALRAAKIKELVRRSLVGQAEQDATRLADENPSDGSLIDLVAAIWKSRAEAGDKDALARGKSWFEACLARRPRSPVLLAGLTSVLIAAGEAQQAADRLQAALDAGGGPDVSRLLEKVLRDDLNHADQADTLTLKRLQGNDLTIGETLELAELQARQGDAIRAGTTISSGIPADAVLTPDQGTRLLIITQQAADHALKDDDQGTLAAAAGLFDLAVQRNVKFSAEMHQKRLSVLARWSQADAPRIIAAAKEAAAEFPTGKGAAFVVASRLLSEAKRGPVALAVISRAVQETTDPDVEMYVEWCRDLVDDGSPADAGPLMQSAERAGKLQELVERVSGPKKETPKSWRAELLYALGNLFTAQGRPDQANETYEMVLREDPDHAWACNNLGYALADKGADIDRASSLLERAHRELPDQAEVTDSLGWLRYKQGVILDETDAATGAVKRQGAVSLLQSAAETEQGKADPTILNHYGDALWLAGRAPDAVHAWESAERLASRRLAASTGQRNAPALGPAESQEMRLLRDSAIAKRRAAGSGGDVAVAPQLTNPHPRPTPDSSSKEPRTGSAQPSPRSDPSEIHEPR